MGPHRTVWDNHPNLRAEFVEMSGELDITHVNPNSLEHAIWRCTTCENVWPSSPRQRIKKSAGCHYCSQNRLHSDRRNSLAVVFPKIALDWDFHKNGDLSPSDVTHGSHKSVWWKCSTCDHSWKTKILVRTRQSGGCSFCNSGRLHSDGRNSLAAMQPHLITEWHPNKNHPLSPNSVTSRNGKRVWWLCSQCGHEWKTSISNRTRPESPTGCPSCAGQCVHSNGQNSLSSLHPELCKEWHPDRNSLSPTEVLPGSHKRVWWLCSDCSHEWRTTPGHRTERISGCPVCNGGALHCDGRNSLLAMKPDYLLDWDYENNSKKPEEVTSRSSSRCAWKCRTCNHQWSSTPKQRARFSGCPACSNQSLHSAGANSFATLFPELLEEYHHSNPQRPTSIIGTGGMKIATEVCKTCDHKWKAAMYPRTIGVGCPKCAPYGFQFDKPAWYYSLMLVDHTGQTLCYKGGLSSDVERRIKQIRKSISRTQLTASVNLLEVILFEDGDKAWLFERGLLRTADIRASLPVQFDGSSELFNQNPLDYARGNPELREFLNASSLVLNKASEVIEWAENADHD